MPVTTPFAAFRDDLQAASPGRLPRAPRPGVGGTASASVSIRAPRCGNCSRTRSSTRRSTPGASPTSTSTPCGPDDLSALPVMTKSDVITEFDDVLTDRRLTRALVEEALAATGTEPRPVLGEYLAFASGGSSGQRGVFVHDRGAQVQFVASVSRGLVARIAATGGPPPGGLPVAIVAAGSAVHLTGTPAAFTANGGLPFRYLPVPATLPIADIVARLNELAAPVLYGYPSMLAAARPANPACGSARRWSPVHRGDAHPGSVRVASCVRRGARRPRSRSST